MPTTLEYMKFSLNVYAATFNNFIAVPFGWDRTNWKSDLASGFSAGCFVKGNEIVISFTGTNDLADKLNWTIGLPFPARVGRNSLRIAPYEIFHLRRITFH